MHELSIAEALLDLVRRRARPGEAVRVVAIEVGALTGLAPESLEFYFDGLTRGTPLESARLECRLVPARMRCPACRGEYAPDGFARVCTRCGALGGEVLAGEELNLLGIEGG